MSDEAKELTKKLNLLSTHWKDLSELYYNNSFKIEKKHQILFDLKLISYTGNNQVCLNETLNLLFGKMIRSTSI